MTSLMRHAGTGKRRHSLKLLPTTVLSSVYRSPTKKARHATSVQANPKSSILLGLRRRSFRCRGRSRSSRCRIRRGRELPGYRSLRRLFLSQPTYAETVLKGMNTARTPIEVRKTGAKKSARDEDLIPTKDVPYREEILSILHLMVGTRPDISYAVENLFEHCENPLITHWTSIKRAQRYIRGTHDHGILFQRWPSDSNDLGTRTRTELAAGNPANRTAGLHLHYRCRCT